MQTQLGSDVLRFLQFSCSSLGQQLSSEGSAWLLCEFIKKTEPWLLQVPLEVVYKIVVNTSLRPVWHDRGYLSYTLDLWIQWYTHSDILGQ